MIYFIDIGEQIAGHPRKFSFYDTGYEKFITYNSEQVWGSWDNFKNAHAVKSRWYPLEIFKSLCPEWVTAFAESNVGH